MSRIVLGSLIQIFLLMSVAGQSTDTTEALKQVGLSADRFTGIGGGSEPIRKLSGNVRLVQDQTTLRSALATQWVESERILFEGNVIIVDEGDTLRSDSVLYFRRTKIGHASGNVVLTDAEVKVTSVSAVYDVDEKHSRFEEGVTLIDSVSTLTGGRGEYFSDEQRAHFYDDVVFRDSSNTIHSDSLVYFRDSETARADGNVLILVEDEPADTTRRPDRIRIAGPSATSDRGTSSNTVSGRATALRLEADSTGAYSDSLLFNADRLTSQRSDSLDILTGGGNVIIWSADVAARADSLEIHSTDSATDEIILTGSPIVWIEDSQLYGDTIRVFVRDDAIDSLAAIGSVFLAQADSVSGRIQHVTGRTLAGRFLSDGKQVFVIGPNAEAVHFVSEEDDLQGAVRASADRIVFYVEDEDPVRISVVSGVEGLYYQADDIPADLQLSGFRWTPDRRPAKEELIAEWPAYMQMEDQVVPQ